MRLLSEDEVRKLTPEQQEMLGDMEVQRMRSRDQLVKRARRDLSMSRGLLTALVCGLAMFSISFPRLLPIIIIVAVAVPMFYIDRLHRRLDAVMELLNREIKTAAERKSAENDDGSPKPSRSIALNR
jgi:hypothetical protein